MFCVAPINVVEDAWLATVSPRSVLTPSLLPRLPKPLLPLAPVASCTSAAEAALPSLPLAASAADSLLVEAAVSWLTSALPEPSRKGPPRFCRTGVSQTATTLEPDCNHIECMSNILSWSRVTPLHTQRKQHAPCNADHLTHEVGHIVDRRLQREPVLHCT